MSRAGLYDGPHALVRAATWADTGVQWHTSPDTEPGTRRGWRPVVDGGGRAGANLKIAGCYPFTDVKTLETVTARGCVQL